MDDLKSFVAHAGRRLDEEAGLAGKDLASGSSGGGSPGSSSLDLASGGKPGKLALPKVESAFIAPASPEQAGGSAAHRQPGSPGGDSADSYERQAGAAEPPPPATAV